MKHAAGAIFPVIVLLTLTLLTYWLKISTSPDEQKSTQASSDPHSIVTNFTLRHINKQGLLEYHLKGSKLTYYEHTDNSVVHQPVLSYFREKVLDTRISSETSLIHENGEKIYLFGNVVVHMPKNTKNPETDILTEEMTVHPDEGTASSPVLVTIQYGKSWIKGTGMELDQEARTFSLSSDVSGTLYPASSL